MAGGGVIYSEATDRSARAQPTPPASRWPRRRPARAALPYDHPGALGAVGATGTRAANLIARDADVVIAVGTRLGDFTTASRTAFQDPTCAS